MTRHEIRANTVLPARREPLTLTTADGLHLVGELALPLVLRPLGAFGLDSSLAISTPCSRGG